MAEFKISVISLAAWYWTMISDFWDAKDLFDWWTFKHRGYIQISMIITWSLPLQLLSSVIKMPISLKKLLSPTLAYHLSVMNANAWVVCLCWTPNIQKPRYPDILGWERISFKYNIHTRITGNPWFRIWTAIWSTNSLIHAQKSLRNLELSECVLYVCFLSSVYRRYHF